MSELDDLAGLLYSKTVEGKLKWHLDNASRISTRQGDNTVDILEFIPQSGYALTVRNKNGISIANKEYTNYQPGLESVKGIFDEAQRESLGANEALSDLKQRLLHL